MKDFVQLITKMFKISLLLTRVGFITTKLTQSPEMTFRDTINHATFFNSLDNFRVGKERKKLSDSLTMAFEGLFKRSRGSRNLPGVLLIISDRDPVTQNETHKITSGISRLQAAGIDVVWVHTGKQLEIKDKGWLYRLLDKTKVFTTDSYSQLGICNKDIRSLICQFGSKYE